VTTPLYTVELWLTDYIKDAYTDQTGMSHFGNVVFARTVATEIGRYDFTCPYSKKIMKDAGIIALDTEGREFRSDPPLDYFGGRHWRGPVLENQKGHWRSAPVSVKGYCYADGSAPVEHLIEKGK
jgi:hypothetical protein